MSCLPLLVSTETWVSYAVVALVLLGIVLLLRNRVRCPKDNHAMQLVVPKQGKHKVFRCPKCGHQRRTRVLVGKRR